MCQLRETRSIVASRHLLDSYQCLINTGYPFGTKFYMMSSLLWWKGEIYGLMQCKLYFKLILWAILWNQPCSVSI